MCSLHKTRSLRPIGLILLFLSCFPWQLAAQTSTPVYRTKGGANDGDIAGATALRFPSDTTLELKAGSSLVVQLAHARAILDLLGTTRGSVIYRGASGWTVLTPGTAGYALISGGAGADPYYGSVAVGAGSIGATELASTAVTPGSYTAANITVDADGRVTAAASGSAGTTLDIDALVEATEADLAGTDRIVISDGGTEKGLSLENLRDYLQSMAWTFATLNVTTLNVTNPPQFATIELGHASDTTLSRPSPGVLAVEGSPVALVGGDIGAATTVTQSPGDNSTKTASTAYVDAAVGSVSTSGITIVSGAPGSPASGTWYFLTGTGRLRYYPNTSDFWESAAYSFTDATVPTLTSATIPTTGDTITLAFSETVSIGSGGSAGWVPTLTGGASAMTYSSGSGTSSLIYALARTVNSGETGTLAYTQPGSGVEDASANDLASIASAAITNNSTQSEAPTYLLSENCEGTDTPPGWSNSGTVSWDAVSPVMEGAQCWFSGATGAYSQYDLGTTYTEFWLRFRFQPEISDGTARDVVSLRSGASGATMECLVEQTGGDIRITHGATVTTISSVDKVTAGAVNFVWVHYVAESAGVGNGQMEVYVESTGTRGTAVRTTIAGTGDAIQYVRLHSENLANDTAFDTIVGDDADPGNF